MSSPGARYRAEILPPGPVYFVSTIYFARDDPEHPIQSLGTNLNVGAVADLGFVRAGKKLRFAITAAGVDPPQDCTAYAPWMTLAWTGPAENNADGLIHARMDCATGRIYFEQICNYPPIGDFDDAIIEVRRQ